jgi:hypothetical protein
MALSIYPEREQIFSLEDITGKIIRAYIDKNMDLLLGDSENNVGGWLNASNGKVYLDVSRVVKTDREAIMLCKRSFQESYFDLKAGMERFIGAHKMAKQATKKLIRFELPVNPTNAEIDEFVKRIKDNK